MYTTSAAYKTAIKNSSRTVSAKVVIGANTYLTDKIRDMQFVDSSNPDQTFEIGTAAASQINLSLIGVNEDFQHVTYQPYMGIDVGGGTIEWIPLGTFYPEEVSKDKNVTSLVLFDGMIKFELPYVSSLTYPATITQVVNEILTKVGNGITLSGTLPSYTIPTKPVGYTCRDVVSMIAAMNGGFAAMDRTNKLVFKSYSSVTESFTSSNYIEYNKKKDVAYRIDKVTCIVDDTTTYTAGTLASGGSEVVFTNPWVTSAILTTIYNSLKTLTFIPTYFRAQGNPAIDVGDIISLTTVEGETLSVPVMNHVLTFDGGITGEMESNGESEVQNQNNTQSGSTSGDIQRDIQAVNGRFDTLTVTTAMIQNLAVTSAKIANLAVGTAQIADASITNAKIGSLAVDTANIKDAAITTAKIGTLQVTTATIADAAITSAKIGSLAVATANIQDAAITNAKIGALAVDTAKIADAAITNAKIDRASVNKLVVDTADIKDAAITTAKIGALQVTAATIANATITGAKIASATITDANIVAATITNASIANATITGAKIASATITGANIASATIGTANIATGAITNALLGTAVVDTGNIKDASITDAKIVSLAATKITAGTIDTGQVTVQGAGGKLRITGNRVQVFDAQATPVERVSMGDVNGDGSVYGFLMRGADGTTVLMDINGVKSAGITDGAITNPKIGAGAVQNTNIAAGTITGDRLVAGTITATQIAAATITANKLVANTITAASGVIADAAIVTAKIADAAITNAKISDLDASKINAGTINVARLAAGSITVDKLDVRAKNKVNNFSTTAVLTGWTSTVGGAATVVADPSTTGARGNVMKTSANANNVMVSSDVFEIDPTKTYKLTMSATNQPAGSGATVNSAARVFFGLYFYDSTGTEIAGTPFTVSSRTFGTASTNPYFWMSSAGQVLAGWYDMEAYMIGSTITDPRDVPSGKNVTTHWRIPPNAKTARIRVLNYYSTAAQDVYFYSPTITDVDSGVVKAERLDVKGLTVNNGTADTFKVDSSGNATFAGMLNGASGTFSGTVSAGTISGGTVDGANIISKSTVQPDVNQIQIQNGKISVFYEDAAYPSARKRYENFFTDKGMNGASYDIAANSYTKVTNMTWSLNAEDGFILASTGDSSSSNDLYINKNGIRYGDPLDDTYAQVIAPKSMLPSKASYPLAQVNDNDLILKSYPSSDVAVLSQLKAVSGGAALVLNAGSQDHTYMEYYARGNATRSGWIGYGTAATNTMTISSDIGDLKLITAGNVDFNSEALVNVGSIKAPSGTSPFNIDMNGGNLQLMSAGSVKATLNTAGNLTIGTALAFSGGNSAVTSDNGYLVMRSGTSATPLVAYIQGSEARATLPSNGASYVMMRASQFWTPSGSAVIDNTVASGQVTITPSAANTPTKVSISFGKTFSVAPQMQVSANTSVPGTQVTGVSFANVTTTGCDIYLTRTNTTSTEVHWFATTV